MNLRSSRRQWRLVFSNVDDVDPIWDPWAGRFRVS